MAQSLHAQLTSLVDSHRLIESAISELNSTSRSPANSIAGLHRQLKLSNQQRLGLADQVADLPHPDITLSILVTRLTEDFKHSRARLRSTQLSLQSKLERDRVETRRRQLLLGGQSPPPTSQPLPPSSFFTAPTPTSTERRYISTENGHSSTEKRHADPTLLESLALTEALKTASIDLESSLGQSAWALQALQESREQLQQLSKNHYNLDSLLHNSRGLLSSLLQSNKTNTWYLETAFYILLVTLAWLVYRRFLYGPLWWFVWLPLRLLWRLTLTVFGVLGAYQGKRGLEPLPLTNHSSSLVSSVSISLSSMASTTISDLPPSSSVPTKPSSMALAETPDPPPVMANTTDQDSEKPRFRGDGTELPPRPTGKPSNPLKRQMEEPPENPIKDKEDSKEKDEL